MGDARASSVVASTPQEVRELLRELDVEAGKQCGVWADKREKDRRPLRTSCRILHVSSDGVSAQTTPGSTRDVSINGMGFVSRKHFRRRSPLIVTVMTPKGLARELTGTVVYSRCVPEGWYLTGMRFGPVDDDRLTRGSSDAAHGTKAATGSTQRSRAARPTGGEQARGGKREQSLSVLAAAATSRLPSKETIDKVIMMSMSSDRVVRRATIPVLMQMSAGGGVLALVQLLDDANSTIQAEAADALGQLNAKQAIAGLQELLRHDKSEVALHAAEALGRMGDKSGLRYLARLVKSDSPLNRRAARALGIVLGRSFRPNSEGVEAARRYLKGKKII